jgi:xanthine/uracil permease
MVLDDSLDGAGLWPMRLEVPITTESLIALIGLSLATGGISYIQDEKTQISLLPANRASDLNPQLSDLIVDYSVRGQGNLSLTRAQLLVLTLLTLLLFVVKSIFEGDLWSLPWELVVLMGLSQASYLASKINPPTKNN